MSGPFSSTAAAAAPPSAEVSRRELNASFHQCVLVLVHMVLYHRRIYPSLSFRLVRYAGLAVWQSRHPGVCAWVRTMIESAMEVINKVSFFF
jgi:mitotic spindle assembly checkpoint protein MAD2B